MFAGTDILTKKLTTEEMGSYLVLRLSFSGVSADGDVKVNFRKYINTAVKMSPRSTVRQRCWMNLLRSTVTMS